MKKLTILAVAICILAMASAAFAQDPADAGIFADAAGTTTTDNPARFVTTNHFYTIVFDAPDGVAGYEYSVNADPAITILSSLTNPLSAINVGTFPSFIVGAGTCLNSVGALTMTDHMYGIFDAVAVDLVACLGSATPSSFAPAVPGYLDCNDNLVPFGVAVQGGPDYDNGCFVLFPTGAAPVGTDSASWGSIKAQY